MTYLQLYFRILTSALNFRGFCDLRRQGRWWGISHESTSNTFKKCIATLDAVNIETRHRLGRHTLSKQVAKARRRVLENCQKVSAEILRHGRAV